MPDTDKDDPNKGDWPATADYPQIWLLGFVAVIWISSRVLPLGLGGLVPIGWLLVVAGVGLMIWASVHFHHAQTSINPFGQPGALITTGPFRHSRNPIYLGDTIVLTGLCLAWQTLPALILVPVFVRLIERRFILREEARLTASFPAGFAEYHRQTPRWL